MYSIFFFGSAEYVPLPGGLGPVRIDLVVPRDQWGPYMGLPYPKYLFSPFEWHGSRGRIGAHGLVRL